MQRIIKIPAFGICGGSWGAASRLRFRHLMERPQRWVEGIIALWSPCGHQPKQALAKTTVALSNILITNRIMERAKGFRTLDPNLGKVVLYP